MSNLRLQTNPPSAQAMPGWFRSAAILINSLLTSVETTQTNPFQMLAAAPSTPVEGQAYYDMATHKLRVYDGTSWQDAW